MDLSEMSVSEIEDRTRESVLRVVLYELADTIGNKRMADDPFAVKLSRMLTDVETRNLKRERQKLGLLRLNEDNQD